MNYRPGFIRRDVKLFHKGSGSFTDVIGQENPDGLVVKEYKMMPQHVDSLFNGETDLKKQAQILNERQKLLKDFFESEIPGSILKTNFVVGETGEGRKTVFEVQEALPSFLSIDALEKDEQYIAQLFGEDYEKKIKYLKNDIKILLKILGNILVKDKVGIFEDVIPDLPPHNIAVTKDGRIKFFDLNFMPKRASWHLGKIRKSIDTLNRILIFLDSNK